MKIALCFHGLPRLINECYDDIYKYFIENNEVDIYSHFWWSEEYCGKVNRLHIKETYPIDYNPIEIFTKLYKPKKIIYEECITYDPYNSFKMNGWTTENMEDETDFYYKLINNYTKYSYYSKFSSQYKSYKFIENKDDYDLIILLRPDLTRFDKTRTFMQDFTNFDIQNNVYFANSLGGGPVFAGEFPNRACEWFDIINPLYIDTYMKIKYETIHDENSRIPIETQSRIIYFVNKANLELNTFNSGITVRRYITEEWEDINYLLSKKIQPHEYPIMFLEDKDNINNNPNLPFYTKYILNWQNIY